MAKFTIEVPVVFYRTYIIEASSAAHALETYNRDIGELGYVLGLNGQADPGIDSDVWTERYENATVIDNPPV